MYVFFVNYPIIMMLESTSRPQAVILMGIPASGKSSFCRRVLEQQGFTPISRDVLKTRHREQVLLAECLENRRSFAVDNTNTLPDERARFIAPARAAGYEVVGYFFRSRVAECVVRNEARGNTVPRVAIAAMSNRLSLPSYAESFDRLYYVELNAGDFVVSDWL